MFELPPNPRSVRILTDPEIERLRAQYPDLPASPRTCVTCRGTGTFRWYFEGEPGDWKCPCEEQFLLHRFLLHAGVELHYQRLFWGDADGIAEDVLAVVEDYIQHFDDYLANGLGLLLWGSMGTGKSMLSALLLKRVLQRGGDGFFATFHGLLDLFTEGWQRSEHKTWFDKRIRNAGLLVIDDIGREHAGRSAVAETALDHVLRTRVAADRPTLITTNRHPDELGTLYSGNALSLLSESAIVHEFRGADYRPRHRQRKIDEAKAGLRRPVVFE